MNSTPKQSGKECKHHWVEDEDFASGAFLMISGGPDSLSEETRVECSKCGDIDFIPKRRIGSLLDIVNEIT